VFGFPDGVNVNRDIMSYFMSKQVFATVGAGGGITRAGVVLPPMSVLGAASVSNTLVADQDSRIGLIIGGEAYDANRPNVDIAVGVSNAAEQLAALITVGNVVSRVSYLYGEVDMGAAGTVELDYTYRVVNPAVLGAREFRRRRWPFR